MSDIPINGRKVFFWFLAFFLTIATVNAVMVTLATRTHTGLVTDHPYEKGLAYNKVVQSAEAQAALGWKAEIAYKEGVLSIVVRDGNQVIIKPEKMRAEWVRPTQSGKDFFVELQGEKTSIPAPEKGVWDVRVDIAYHGAHYQQSQRVIVE